jgi:hypothetical protein
MLTTGKAPDFDLTSVELSLAKDTKALIIERIPTPEVILDTQNQEPIEFEMGNHTAKSSLLVASKHTIGTLDDCVIGQNPTTSFPSNGRRTLRARPRLRPAGAGGDSFKNPA